MGLGWDLFPLPSSQGQLEELGLPRAPGRAQLAVRQPWPGPSLPGRVPAAGLSAPIVCARVHGHAGPPRTSPGSRGRVGNGRGQRRCESLCLMQAFERVRGNLQAAKSPPWTQSFTNKELISDAVVQNGGVLASHPLSF